MVENTDNLKGRAKVAAGAITGDKELEKEGRIDRVTGDAKAKIGEATDKLEDVLGTAKDKASDALTKTKDALEGLVDKAKR